MNDYLNNEIAGASNETLRQWMANAVTTGAQCSGHGKGHQNDVLAKQYRNALIERGENVPEIDFWKCLDDPNSYRDQLYKVGEYNGPGSF